MKYSIFSLARNAISHHEKWPQAWRSPDPRERYDVLIIGGGGHGLATAYYLAKNHGITNVAVLEKGWIGGGNTGRNTAIIRSNFLNEGPARIYEESLKLWETLTRELNFNMMFGQRGVLTLAHTDHDLRKLRRIAQANRAYGFDAEILNPDEIARFVPIINVAADARYPIMGATLQRRGGIARHDAMAWGYARAADAFGVDIIQNCEVTGILRDQGRISGVETSRGTIRADKVGVTVAGHSSVLAEMAGFRLPVMTRPLQAYVTEPVKPLLHTVVMSYGMHIYVSQSDRGELVISAPISPYSGYAQRGSLSLIEHTASSYMKYFPVFSRLRMMRQWAGIIDITPDASPIISKTPVAGLYFNVGWAGSGFKATPGGGLSFAHMIANDDHHPWNADFALDRFHSGQLVDAAVTTAIEK